MKKTISFMLCAAIALSASAPAFAADSDKMKTALASVKTRIDVPEELSVFRSGVMNEKDENTGYSFRWNNEEETETIYVNADSEGRISYYSYSQNETEHEGLADITKDEARGLADEMISKAAPELFADKNDCLVFKSGRGFANVGYSYFDFTYVRMHDGAQVHNNSASVSVRACADAAYVSSMSISWDYDTDFSQEKATLENPQDRYIEMFPAELLYARRNGDHAEPIVLKDGTKLSDEVMLQYSFKNSPGYISAVTGEELAPDSEDYRKQTSGGSAGGNAAMAEMAADSGVSFTEEELAELDRVENLISEERAEQIVRSVSALKLSDGMTRSYVSIFRRMPWYFRDDNNTDNENFLMRIGFENEESGRSVYAQLDAETGEILSISNYGYYNEPEDSSGNADAAVKQLISEVCAEKAAECEQAVENDGEYYFSGSARRLVNGVPYRNNYISYSYDKRHSRISSYDLEWDEYTEHFTDPKEAIGLEEAAKRIFEAAPLELIYIKNGGVFRLCYTISKSSDYTDIDAVTGEPLKRDTAEESARINYSDISGHWAESAIRRLAEVGMCEAADAFRPDEEMTQLEMLRFFAGAFFGSAYKDFTEDALYSMLERRGLVKEGEKNPESAVVREDAFVYMIRFMGYERVAKLSGIFSCDYADTDSISPDKMGYAAILTGFGAITGDVNSIRAKDNIKRAEAVMMVYRYLTCKI